MKNIRLISRYFLLSLICCLFVACKYDIYQVFFRGPVVDNRASSITDIEALTVNGDIIRFAIITDLHYGSGKSQGENQLISNLSEGDSLDFIVVLGDVVETGFDEYFEQCEDFIGKLKAKLPNPDLPIYVVLGNHDLYYNGLGRWKQLNFSKNKGASFFRFKTTSSNGTTRSWYFLDTASAVVGTRQMKALSNEMKSDNNPKIVFTHYPIFVDKEFSTPFKLSDPREQARLIDLFDKNKVDMVFSGHWHDGGTISYGYFSEVCCASFVENSVKQSSWFVLTLQETLQEGTTPTLSIEHFKAHGDDISSSTQEYSLQNGR